VSNVWETRDRLLLEQLEQLTKRLNDEEPIELTELTEQAVRLLAGAVMLLRQHYTNKRGQCQYCGWTRRARRFWHRRPRCTVYRDFGLAFHQRMDMVWRQLLENHKTRPKPRRSGGMWRIHRININVNVRLHVNSPTISHI